MADADDKTKRDDAKALLKEAYKEARAEVHAEEAAAAKKAEEEAAKTRTDPPKGFLSSILGL